MHSRQDDSQLKDRLNQIAEKITSEAFLSGQGLGNEIGFWIFDYPPEHELQVREYLTFLEGVLARQHGELTVDHVNLLRDYQILPQGACPLHRDHEPPGRPLRHYEGPRGNSKSDLFSIFIERNLDLVVGGGRLA